MSRVSRKSELSPSITRGSNGIDLGKNSGIDMGRKSQPSLTSGGIGITEEVTTVGGASVSAGIEIDITPVDFGVNIDRAEGTVSIATGAEIPGGVLGVSGGIEVNINTGEITGGSIGAEVAGLGINLSNSKKGGLGIEFTVQIPGTPIELSLGFGFPPKEDPTSTPTPTPTPTPATFPGTPLPDPPAPNLTCRLYFEGYRIIRKLDRDYYQTHSNDPIKGNTVLIPVEYDDTREERLREVYPNLVTKTDTELHYMFFTFIGTNAKAVFVQITRPVRFYVFSVGNGITFSGVEFREVFGTNIENATDMTVNRNYHQIEKSTGETVIYNADGKSVHYGREKLGYNNTTNKTIWGEWQCMIVYENNIQCADLNLPPPALPPPPFPNPPPKRKNKMDDCCRENLKFLRAIYTRLGLAKFPGSLPTTIIQEIPKEGEKPAEPPKEPIVDFVDLFMWQFRRDDERWGQWEIQIDVKDTDLTKEGNQGKSIKFPNLAESVAEMEGQMLSILANVEALVALSVRNLSESGLARQEAIKGYLASMAIAKYMAFPYEEIEIDIPSTYTPGATSIDKLIIESIVHAKGIDYNNKETLRDVFLDLLQAAAINRAVHWRQVDPKSDIKKQILSQLKGSAELSEKITNVKGVSVDGETKDKGKESWEDKLDQYENGFGFVTGIENANTPYGRDRERRPRIRQIGDNIAQAGKNE